MCGLASWNRSTQWPPERSASIGKKPKLDIPKYIRTTNLNQIYIIDDEVFLLSVSSKRRRVSRQSL